MQRNRDGNHTLRLIAVAALFCVVCLVYVIRLAVIQSTAEDAGKSGAEYTRTEEIPAMRGEIYDRNGVKLVANKYVYDIVLRYAKFPGTRSEQNETLIRVVDKLIDCGCAEKIQISDSPFEGIYPDISYKSDLRDADSTHYARLKKYSAHNELTEDGLLPDCRTLVEYMLTKYGLAERRRDADGNKYYKTLYPDETVTNLLNLYFVMDLADFGVFVDFPIAEDVGMDDVTYMVESGIPCVDFETRYEREYLYPGYATHILGQLGSIYREDWESYRDKGYEMDDKVGRSGCEAAFEDYLRGRNGQMAVVEDGDGNVIKKYVITEPTAGKNVYLTIDINVQIAAEDGIRENAEWVSDYGYSIDCKSGAIVAIDPDTFELLAIASYPTYDLTVYSETYAELSADGALPLLNRATNGIYAPGSTFKIGMSAIGLTEGEITAHTAFHCSGRYTFFSGYQPRCWIYPESHGDISVTHALAVSCNCFYYELGRRLGIDVMNEYCRAFGLGEHTGIELPEKIGILAGPEWRRSQRFGEWQETDTIAAAIGQSENAFTPVQIAAYVSTVLNGGTRRAAHLLYAVGEFGEAPGVFPEAEILSETALSDSTIATVTAGMKEMVDGSSMVAGYMKGLPVKVGGKSGTAQTGSGNDNALFACAAPYDDPEIVVVSVLEKGAGGSYASLSCSRVLKEFYRQKELDK